MFLKPSLAAYLLWHFEAVFLQIALPVMITTCDTLNTGKDYFLTHQHIHNITVFYVPESATLHCTMI